MKIKELKKRLDEIIAENPDATIGLLTYTDGRFSSADIDFVTKQDDGHDFDYLIQP